MALNYVVLPQALSKFIHLVHCLFKSFLVGEITNGVGWKKHYMQLNQCLLSQIHACVIRTAICRVHQIVVALATVST